MESPSKILGWLVASLAFLSAINRWGELGGLTFFDVEIIVFFVYIGVFFFSAVWETFLTRMLQTIFIFGEALRIFVMGGIEDLPALLVVWNFGILVAISYGYLYHYRQVKIIVLIVATFFLMAFFLMGKLDDPFYKAFRREVLIGVAYVIVYRLFKRHIAFKLEQSTKLLRKSLKTMDKSVQLHRDMYSDIIARDHSG